MLTALLVIAIVFGLYVLAGVIGLANLIATGRADGSEDP